MKKLLSFVIFGFLSANLCTYAATYSITPKAPKITPALKPIIEKYKKGNYIGSMQDLEDLVKVEKKNIYAKYYLALCYTRLGYKQEAMTLYNEIVDKDENLALSYYSQKALNCLDNPEGAACKPIKKEEEEKPEELTDMDMFIRSGKKIHPAAMDRITKERMEHKMIEEEHLRTQQQQASINGEKKSYNEPTNEEIANALDTLSKIGLNPFKQFNPLAQAQQLNISDYSNPMVYAPFLNNSNQDMAKMFLYNQLSQQNNMLNYGI